MKEPVIPAHVAAVVTEIVANIPVERREAIRRLVEHVYRGAFIDGMIAASCEEAARIRPPELVMP